jgi:hypothetical protein
MRVRCAAWGGVSLGIGTLAFALCSPSSAGCSTNLVVLTHGAVTARGCAAYSMIARVGVGLMVLGAVLLLGSFILAVRFRRQAAPHGGSDEVAPSPPDAAPVPSDTAASHPAPVSAPPVSAEAPGAPVASPVEDVPRLRPPVRVGPIPPGEDGPDWGEPAPDRPVVLPPGWYGNPGNPDKPVQWWDGTRLTDRPSPGGR